MPLLKREDLLKRDKFKIEKVDLGNGDYVYVRQMSGRERDRFEQSLIKIKVNPDGSTSYERDLEDFRAKLAVNTICDENGNNLLRPEDYKMLSQNMTAAKLEKIVEVAQRLNAITIQDEERLVKNLKNGQSGGSISDSAES